LGAVEKIERYVSGMDHDAFVRDEKTIDSVVRNLEIIGEAPPLAGRFQETVPRDQVASNHWSQTSDRSRLFQYRRWDCMADYPNRLAGFQIPDIASP
jgi:uncharacterized protein with HEPN domain